MRGTLLAVKRAPAPFVVRHAVTGAVRHTSPSRADCESWCDEHPQDQYLVVERRDECHPFDVCDARGMLRNVPVAWLSLAVWTVYVFEWSKRP